jgi:hypothetical protein
MVKQTLSGYKMGVHNAYGLPRCNPTDCFVGSRALYNVSSNVFLTISWCRTHERRGYGRNCLYVRSDDLSYPRAQGLWDIETEFNEDSKVVPTSAGVMGSVDNTHA